MYYWQTYNKNHFGSAGLQTYRTSVITIPTTAATTTTAATILPTSN